MDEKWEYDVQAIKGDTAQVKATLNQLGNVGWDLAQIVGQDYYFKREKVEGRKREGGTSIGEKFTRGAIQLAD